MTCCFSASAITSQSYSLIDIMAYSAAFAWRHQRVNINSFLYREAVKEFYVLFKLAAYNLGISVKESSYLTVLDI